jgi:RNA polymerase sigma-70 factor (sigma-E family)
MGDFLNRGRRGTEPQEAEARQTLSMTTMMSVVREASHADEADRFVRAVGTEQRRLAGLAYVLCGDRDVAEELVAEAFARVWPKWRAGHVDDLPAYLRRALVNLVQGRYRRRVLERRELGRRTVDWRDGQRFEPGVEMRGELWTALLRLPLEQRTVIVLRHVEDLSEDETAAVLNLRPGTVKSRLARGLATLRAELEGDR